MVWYTSPSIIYLSQEGDATSKLVGDGSVFGYRYSVISNRLSVFGKRLTDYRLRTTDYGLRTTDYGGVAAQRKPRLARATDGS
jgi:hypothetical protein